MTNVVILGFREIRFLGAERLPERVQRAGTAHNVR